MSLLSVSDISKNGEDQGRTQQNANSSLPKNAIFVQTVHFDIYKQEICISEQIEGTPLLLSWSNYVINSNPNLKTILSINRKLITVLICLAIYKSLFCDVPLMFGLVMCHHTQGAMPNKPLKFSSFVFLCDCDEKGKPYAVKTCCMNSLNFFFIWIQQFHSFVAIYNKAHNLIS